MKQRPNKLSMLGLAFALAFAGAAQAAVVAVPTVTSSGDVGATTTPSPVPVNFTGDGETVGFQAHINFDTTNVDATVVGVNGGVCSVNGAGNSIIVLFSTADSTPIAAGPTNFCNITFTFTGDVPAPGSIALDVDVATAPGDGCLNAAATPAATCTATDGAITVQDVNTPPTITYNPTFDADGTSDAAAEVTFPGGNAGSPSTSSITVTASGGAAVASTSIACTATAPFTITSGANQTFNSPASGGAPINLSVNLTAAAQTGTLTCIETDTPGGATRTRLWDLAAPAGVASPELVTSPADGGTLGLQGLPGATVSGNVQVQNTGLADLTITGCAVTAGFTLGTVSSPIAAGGTGTIGVSCVTPTTAGTSATGTLTCNTNDTSEPTLTINLSCSALSASIPTVGFGGKALLAMLMLGLGLAAFQLYRRA